MFVCLSVSVSVCLSAVCVHVCMRVPAYVCLCAVCICVSLNARLCVYLCTYVCVNEQGTTPVNYKAVLISVYCVFSFNMFLCISSVTVLT